MKTKGAVIGILAVATVTFAALAAQYELRTEPRTVSRGYMRQKLVYSQGILEGLSLEKFDLVTKNAIRVRNMKLTNVMYAVKNPLYMSHITNYHHAIDRLLEASTEKDLARSTRAYQGVIQSCVDCHRDYRTEQKKSAGDRREKRR